MNETQPPSTSRSRRDRRHARGRLSTRAKRIIAASVCSFVLVAGAGSWWALDRFVIPHVEISDVAAYEQQQSEDESDGFGETSAENSTTQLASDVTVTATSYESEDASISIQQYTEGTGTDTVTYYVADVTLSSATTLESAFAQNQFGENITDLVSSIATDAGAVFAINGDYYGFRDTGIVIRNGVVFRDEAAREGLVFYEDGSVEIYDETQTSADELVANGAWNTMSFGPALVADGVAVEGIDEIEIDTNVGNHSIQGEQPRTAVGIIDENHLVFVVVDGRDDGYSRGVTLPELADIFVDLGATTAYNLDGGGSSEMWFNGDVVNQPSNGGERATSDIFYISEYSS